jgi:hypothetical protein
LDWPCAIARLCTDCDGWELDGDFNPAGVNEISTVLLRDRLSDTSSTTIAVALHFTRTYRMKSV